MAAGHCCIRQYSHILRASQQLPKGNTCRPWNLDIKFIQRRHKYFAPGNRGFYFPDKKMGLEKQLQPEDDLTLLQKMSEGLEICKREIPLWKQEWLRRIHFDEDYMMKHNDYQYFAKFNKESVSQWSVSADSQVSDGKSTAELTLSPSGKGLFHGVLNTEPLKDGYTKKSGFCNISSPKKKISFGRFVPYDFMGYTDLALRIRGDGRNYMVLLQMDNHFSVHWYDMYNYPLFTRGGPYWQFVKIPFSKFFLSSCGRIQDTQHQLNLSRIRDIGITLADGVNGPFELEIDYIALLRDENTSENDFEYEMYKKEPYIV